MQQSVCSPVGVRAPLTVVTAGQVGAMGVPVNPALPQLLVKLQSLLFDPAP
jgi:hypothetical protein